MPTEHPYDNVVMTTEYLFNNVVMTVYACNIYWNK